MSLFQYCTKRLFSLKQDLQTTLPTMLFDLLAYASTMGMRILDAEPVRTSAEPSRIKKVAKGSSVIAIAADPQKRH